MQVPNWKHHSKKEQKRKLKPQALRDAKRRRSALLSKFSETHNFIKNEKC
mgnify:FL=1|jgi:hypothetical protein